MGVPKSEHYWNKNNHKYPHQITVPWKSKEDIDPVVVQKLVSFHFLRVPFDGISHWGFLTKTDLDNFLRLHEHVP